MEVLNCDEIYAVEEHSSLFYLWVNDVQIFFTACTSGMYHTCFMIVIYNYKVWSLGTLKFAAYLTIIAYALAKAKWAL